MFDQTVKRQAEEGQGNNDQIGDRFEKLENMEHWKDRHLIQNVDLERKRG